MGREILLKVRNAINAQSSGQLFSLVHVGGIKDMRYLSIAKRGGFGLLYRIEQVL